MPNYKDMYFKLFDKITSAINILQWAQREGEETYIESDDASIIKLFNDECEADEF